MLSTCVGMCRREVRVARSRQGTCRERPHEAMERESSKKRPSFRVPTPLVAAEQKIVGK